MLSGISVKEWEQKADGSCVSFICYCITTRKLSSLKQPLLCSQFPWVRVVDRAQRGRLVPAPWCLSCKTPQRGDTSQLRADMTWKSPRLRWWPVLAVSQGLASAGADENTYTGLCRVASSQRGGLRELDLEVTAQGSKLAPKQRKPKCIPFSDLRSHTPAWI